MIFVDIGYVDMTMDIMKDSWAGWRYWM